MISRSQSVQYLTNIQGNGSETEHIPQPGVFKERGIAFTLPLLDNNALTENVKLQFKQNKRLEGPGQRI